MHIYYAEHFPKFTLSLLQVKIRKFLCGFYMLRYHDKSSHTTVGAGDNPDLSSCLSYLLDKSTASLWKGGRSNKRQLIEHANHTHMVFAKYCQGQNKVLLGR